MTICTQCGHENPEANKFCGECAAPLGAPPKPPREVRKTVTVVFCDIAGSTAKADGADPEVVRAVLGRYYEQMRAVLEGHGGTVEKFIGDAVMAVFGVPVVREDDALRAVRAAAEMCDELVAAGITARIGVNTGEVVAAPGESLVTGDAVNVAARLEQAAPVGGVLIGDATLALVRDAARVERVEPLAAKGKRDPLIAWRLVEVSAGGLGVVEAFSKSFDEQRCSRSDIDRQQRFINFVRQSESPAHQRKQAANEPEPRLFVALRHGHGLVLEMLVDHHDFNCRASAETAKKHCNHPTQAHLALAASRTSMPSPSAVAATSLFARYSSSFFLALEHFDLLLVLECLPMHLCCPSEPLTLRRTEVLVSSSSFAFLSLKSFHVLTIWFAASVPASVAKIIGDASLTKLRRNRTSSATVCTIISQFGMACGGIWADVYGIRAAAAQRVANGRNSSSLRFALIVAPSVDNSDALLQNPKNL